MKLYEIKMDQAILITGLTIFIARILDVSLGTMRTIVTVQGRIVCAFILGIFEIVIWITVVGTVISQLKENPVLIVFYALGYATGNVVGILVERKIALGPIILKLIVEDSKKDKIIKVFQKLELEVTSFNGMGTRGPVTELYTVCRRRDLKLIIPKIRNIDPNTFYVTEQARDVSRVLKPVGSKPGIDNFKDYHMEHLYLTKILKPILVPLTGWRAALKKK